jgi:hypothetical protein
METGSVILLVKKRLDGTPRALVYVVLSHPNGMIDAHLRLSGRGILPASGKSKNESVLWALTR